MIESLRDSPEIQSAATWWANQLREFPEQDAGYFGGANEISQIATAFSRIVPPISEEAIEMFRVSLIEQICVHEMWVKSWHEAIAQNNPMLGSYCRVVATDYGPDKKLDDALSAAGITQGMLRLPMKTVMWINPGSVRVRPGYSATERQIYPRMESRAGERN